MMHANVLCIQHARGSSKVVTDETIFLISVSGEFARKMLKVFWSWFLTSSLHASGTLLLNSFFAIRDGFLSFLLVHWTLSWIVTVNWNASHDTCVTVWSWQSILSAECWKIPAPFAPKTKKKIILSLLKERPRYQTCDEKKQNHLFSDFYGQILFDWKCNLR